MQAQLTWDVFHGSQEAAKMIQDLVLDKAFEAMAEKELVKRLKPYAIIHTF
jgi:hypothetical protein